MPFLRYYPEPAAVLVAQILYQARTAKPAAPECSGAPEPAVDVWGEDGALARVWFAQGDAYANISAHGAEQGGTHA